MQKTLAKENLLLFINSNEFPKSEASVYMDFKRIKKTPTKPTRFIKNKKLDDAILEKSKVIK